MNVERPVLIGRPWPAHPAWWRVGGAGGGKEEALSCGTLVFCIILRQNKKQYGRIYDNNGQAGALLIGDAVYNKNGSFRLWVIGHNLYNTNGDHVGWTEGGVFYDSNNDVIGFIGDYTGHLPSNPGVCGAPGMPGIGGKPGRPGLSDEPGRPGYGGWSRVKLEDYIESVWT